MANKPHRQRITHAMLKAEGIDIIKDLGKLIPKLDPDEQVRTLLNLASFVYPKPKVVEHKLEDSGKITMTIGGE